MLFDSMFVARLICPAACKGIFNYIAFDILWTWNNFGGVRINGEELKIS